MTELCFCGKLQGLFTFGIQASTLGGGASPLSLVSLQHLSPMVRLNTAGNQTAQGKTKTALLEGRQVTPFQPALSPGPGAEVGSDTFSGAQADSDNLCTALRPLLLQVQGSEYAPGNMCGLAVPQTRFPLEFLSCPLMCLFVCFLTFKTLENIS